MRKRTDRKIDKAITEEKKEELRAKKIDHEKKKRTTIDVSKRKGGERTLGLNGRYPS